MSALKIDPVCKMTVSPESSAGHTDYGGNTYYFCSPVCKQKFDQNPESYLAIAKAPSGVAQLTPLTMARLSKGSQTEAARSTDVKGELVDLPITGMTCAACARHIEQNLSSTPGVQRAGVNFATSRATVEYDPAATNVRQLMNAVEELGYRGARSACRSERSRKISRARRARLNTLTCGGNSGLPRFFRYLCL